MMDMYDVVVVVVDGNSRRSGTRTQSPRRQTELKTTAPMLMAMMKRTNRWRWSWDDDGDE
jgi:hypothetical protein